MKNLRIRGRPAGRPFLRMVRSRHQLMELSYTDIRVAADVVTHVMRTFRRITVSVDQMGGVPCIRGLRIPVATVLKMLAAGMAEQEILAEYPDLQTEDIREALRWAAAAALERELPLPETA